MIIGGYFVYQEYIYPIYLNNLSQEKSIVLSKEQKVMLIKRPEQTSIYGIEIEISPNKETNYSVVISEINDVKYEISVKKGREFTYKTDWYSDTCFLSFRPHEISSDTLKVNYRFLGLND